MIPATFTGYLGKDAETQQLKDNRSVTRLRIGCNDSYRDSAGEWQQSETYWLWAEAWGPLAEAISDWGKGTPVIVFGSWRERSYETKDGERRTARYVVLEAAGINVAAQASSTHEGKAEQTENEPESEPETQNNQSDTEQDDPEGGNPL
ncbi:single-stranded DNA-binding protein [Rothia uropygialis]|uniref:single-stranded DNA-binding protein n=1 Tax=Kocuria sp. 36 TaxID=1415402 RepID=UPI0013EAFF0E|nr:single-stranded DNA-binding protein [Kocuria sp. 36]